MRPAPIVNKQPSSQREVRTSKGRSYLLKLWVYGTRAGFAHYAELLSNGVVVSDAKVNYHNRTWEGYQGQTVYTKAINSSPIPPEEKEEILNKLSSRSTMEAKLPGREDAPHSVDVVTRHNGWEVTIRNPYGKVLSYINEFGAEHIMETISDAFSKIGYDVFNEVLDDEITLRINGTDIPLSTAILDYYDFVDGDDMYNSILELELQAKAAREETDPEVLAEEDEVPVYDDDPMYEGSIQAEQDKAVLTEAVAGWIAILDGKRVEIRREEADSLYSAKKLAIQKLAKLFGRPIPKSKESLMSIEPAYDEAELTSAPASSAQFESKLLTEGTGNFTLSDEGYPTYIAYAFDWLLENMSYEIENMLESEGVKKPEETIEFIGWNEDEEMYEYYDKDTDEHFLLDGEAPTSKYPRYDTLSEEDREDYEQKVIAEYEKIWGPLYEEFEIADVVESCDAAVKAACESYDDDDEIRYDYGYPTVELVGGYYAGASIVIKDTDGLEATPELKTKVLSILEDHFGKGKNKASQSGEGLGLFKIKVDYRFSNGETGYSKVEATMTEALGDLTVDISYNEDKEAYIAKFYRGNSYIKKEAYSSDEGDQDTLREIALEIGDFYDEESIIIRYDGKQYTVDGFLENVLTDTPVRMAEASHYLDKESIEIKYSIKANGYVAQVVTGGHLEKKRVQSEEVFPGKRKDQAMIANMLQSLLDKMGDKNIFVSIGKDAAGSLGELIQKAKNKKIFKTKDSDKLPEDYYLVYEVLAKHLKAGDQLSKGTYLHPGGDVVLSVEMVPMNPIAEVTISGYDGDYLREYRRNDLVKVYIVNPEHMKSYLEEHGFSGADAYFRRRDELAARAFKE